MYHKKRIGLFISHIYGDYQARLSTGITRKAAECGYMVDIFASNDGENLGDYGIGESSILQIPRPDNYDGFILASGTYLQTSLEEDILNLLKSEFTCPIININKKDTGYPSVVLENHFPITEIVLHLGRVHHYKRICYLGCRQESAFNQPRQQAFINGMKELALPFEDSLFSCDTDLESIKEAIDRILENTPYPEAIVCYNDQIALIVISILKARGLNVPNDIAVTGCDTLEFGQNIPPVLTSVTFPIDELGEKAVEQLSRLFHGETIEPNITVYAKPSYGTSCGCSSVHSLSEFSYSRKLDRHIASLEKNVISDMYMSANLQGVDDVDQGMNLIVQFAENLPDCRELYLCLYEGWDSVSSHIREITLTDEDEYDSDTVLLKLALKDGKRLPECTFTKHNILPDYLYDGVSTSYVYAPLFFGERCFGYLALSFKNGRPGYSFHFISWLMNVNTMLQNICDKKNLGLLVGRLEDIYTKDELTGLLNRQGFKIAYQPLIEKAVAQRLPVLILMYDLDCLKLINDTFGHAEGNFAIQVIAHALESSIEEGDVCSRQGGDEFEILAIGYTHEKALQLIDKVQKYLDNYNKLHTKDYLIQASSGFCIRVPSSPSELADMFKDADMAMYREKKNKVKQVIKKSPEK